MCCGRSSGPIPASPRIGDSATRRDEYVDLGQDPYLEFPASNLASVAEREGRLKIIVKFLGLLGPQGALPLPTTDESLGWLLMRDDAFPRFLDLFNGRFLQLFFRAWSNSRPIGQHDRPSQDRFIAYIGSVIGLGTKPYSNLDSIPDIAKLEYAGLLAPKAKCASRLERFLRGMFGVRVEIDEFVGSWLVFDPDDRTAIGRKHAALGKDMLLGSSVFSVEDKIRIRLYVNDFAQYEQFLPSEGSNLSRPLADAVFFYIGDELDWDVELAIPSGAGGARPARPRRKVGVDELGIAQLGVDRRIPVRRAISSDGTSASRPRRIVAKAAGPEGRPGTIKAEKKGDNFPSSEPDGMLYQVVRGPLKQ